MLKIADFGLARYVSEDDLAETIAGSPAYVAPEVLSKKPYDYRCDYWSLGVCLYLLLSAELPFQHKELFATFELIKKGEFSFKAASWKAISEEAKDLINGLLVTEPDYRLNKTQILKHPWVNGSFEASDE